MFNSTDGRKFGIGALGCLLLCGIFAADVPAQTNKRVKRKTRVVRRLPAVPVSGNPQDASVISRNDDYADQNKIQPQIVETPVQPENSNQLENDDPKISELSSRIKALEVKPTLDYDQKQKRLLLNLDILTRAETRAESLRKQIFEMVEKESEIQQKLEQIQNDSRSENIDRSVAFAGTLRPEELRDMRAKNLDSAKRQLQTLLIQVQETKSNLETNVLRADQLVEKLRIKLEKDIDDALVEEPKN